MTLRIFYDAGASAAGGVTIQPSIQEVRAAAQAKGNLPPQQTSQIIVTPAGDIKPGDGTPPIANLSEEEAKQKLEADNIAKGLNPDGSPKTEDPPAKTPEQIAEEERNVAAGKNPDGTDITPEPELTDAEIVAKFWSEVEAKSGKPVKVEYPEGVDPLSPEGVFLRENAVRDQAIADFDEAIRAANPRGYAYMMHLQNGGTDEEFLGKGAGFLLPDRALLETDVAVQTMIYKTDLKAKGLDDENAQVIIDKAIKDNKLKEKSIAAYDSIHTLQTNQLKALQEQEQLEQKRQEQMGIQFNAAVDKVLPNMKFVVPATELPGFKKFIDDNVRVDERGQIILVQSITTDSLQSQLEALYFLHKKGDLGKIVQKQAATQTSQRLRTQLDKTKPSSPKSNEDTKKPVLSISLSEMMKLRMKGTKS